MNLTFIIRRLFKTKSLRIINLLGLSVVFACMTLSFLYVQNEFSYDRFNANARRMARLSVRYGEVAKIEMREQNAQKYHTK